MQNFKNKFFFIIFVVVWGAIIVWNFVTPNQSFSEAENRTLASFPHFTVETLLDGDYMDGVDTYLNDHFAGRPYWVSGQSLMEYGLGKREINNVFIGNNALLGSTGQPDADIAAANIAGVNAFAAQYKIPTYTLLIPSSTAVQPQNLPTFAEDWDEEGFIKTSNVAFGQGVTPVDAWTPLAAHSDEYIYYRTDHHWTTYGASLAYAQLAGAMGLPNRAQEFTTQTVSTTFEGTYQSKTGFPLVQKDTIELYQAGQATTFSVFNGAEEVEYDSIFFPEFLQKKDQYSYFLGQVQPYVTVYTGAGTGKKLLLFKDSYAHCLTPMLLADYDEIRLVDLRYLNGANIGSLVQAEQYDEALFLYSADVFAHQKVSGKLQ
ncbi:hypothetical protein LJC61_00365 [Ruminococcaceae bacterium OttesenSCG-928-A16]|nr:hypothetical protein [Ruminococcaceae bacterium OttesenSCG-928-A16]